jgi:hypothetical protein
MTSFLEARTQWQADRRALAARGFIVDDSVVSYLTPEMKYDSSVAMDALPVLQTNPNSALPMILTTFIDPETVRIAFSPTQAAVIGGEVKKGDWTDDTLMFTVLEATGEVSSYGDFAENGNAGVNAVFPQRQPYRFQAMKEYGELEVERAGLAKMNYVAEVDRAAVENLNRFANLDYFFGIQGLQNYGLTNDPNLSGVLTPSTKLAGGKQWISSGGVINAQPTEIYADFQTLFYTIVSQTGGLVTAKDKLCMALSPTSAVALTAANSFGTDVGSLLKQNFPNIRVETAVQYGMTSTTNPYGIAAGNMVQLFAESIDGKDTGFCVFTEKMRAHKMETRTSSWKQKVSSATAGYVNRYPAAFATMVGI